MDFQVERCEKRVKGLGELDAASDSEFEAASPTSPKN
jgi:hypothetical protein